MIMQEETSEDTAPLFGRCVFNSLRVRGLFVCVRTRVLFRGGDSLCVTGQTAEAECPLSSPHLPRTAPPGRPVGEAEVLFL